MPKCILLQTEKAYQLQNTGVFTLCFDDKNFDINKIELAKILKQSDLEVTSVAIVKPYQKIKRKGKHSKKISQYRPKKYYVKLATSKLIDEETLNRINEKLNS